MSEKDKETKPKKVDIKDYTQEQIIGIGAFDVVKIGRNKNSNYFAIKIIKKAEAKKMAQVDHVLNEVKILSMIDHPFLVRK